MANFYVLPPRAILQRQLRKIVEAHLPGLPVDEERMLDLFHSQAGEGHFNLHREDLPEGVETASALCDYYGAEEGDLLIQISSGASVAEPRVTRLSGLKIAA